MTAQQTAIGSRVPTTPLTLDDARDHVASTALTEGPIGAVGLELEAHLVDLAAPEARVSWNRIVHAVAALPPLPSASRVTVEPGGQVELSTVPAGDIVAAITALQQDERVLRASLATQRLGLAGLGTDPARAARRVNTGARYASMERHWEAVGCGPAGRSMMCSTASLQVNVEAGPAVGWSARVALAHRLGPVFVAMSACSPYLAGNASGWVSMRQQVWGELDQQRCGPLLDGALPADEWADYALQAPVMLVRGELNDATAVNERASFASWASGETQLGGRAPTTADLDYHLTTLFPPVRPRGWLEVRCLDAVPRRWLPALAAIAVILLDDAGAADVAADACEPVHGAWERAAQHGLADAQIARAVRGCVDAAVAHCPPPLKREIEQYADLVASGRTPGDLVREYAERNGPVAALQEYAGA